MKHLDNDNHFWNMDVGHPFPDPDFGGPQHLDIYHEDSPGQTAVGCKWTLCTGIDDYRTIGQFFLKYAKNDPLYKLYDLLEMI